MKINIGCGKKKYNGFVNIDKLIIHKPDILWDIEFGLPPMIKENTVTHVVAHHILEHINRYEQLMIDIHKVCKPGAKIDILVPEAPGEPAFRDPTHVRFFTKNSFLYFDEWRYLYGYPHFKTFLIRHDTSPDKNLHVILEVIK